MSKPSPITAAVRAGVESDEQNRAVVPPIYLSTTYRHLRLEGDQPYDYSRAENPTRDVFASALADLEGGAGGVVTGSGIGAMNLVTTAMLSPGDVVVAPQDFYSGTWRLLTALAEKMSFTVRFADLTSTEGIAEAMAWRPTLVWVETPSNPLLRITDIEAVSTAARAVGAKVVVDNTFLSPALQNPLSLGADVVIHSCTKFINGHSDVVMGAAIAGAPDLVAELSWWANCLGLTASAFDSYLALRGLRTLHARMRVHQENAHAVVEAIVDHPAVSKVYFPGLTTHPGHALASRQQRGFGALVSLELTGGRKAVDAFLDGLENFSLAESLGGVESLVAHPQTMTHLAMPEEVRRASGIVPGLLRFSIGIEESSDLVAGIISGLERAATVAR